MAERISVELSDGRFLVHAGAPGGRDGVHAAITRWPGWKRSPGPAKVGDIMVSAYSAPISPTSAVALANTTMNVLWQDGAKECVEAILMTFREVRSVLDTPRPGAILAFATDRQPMLHQAGAIQAIKFMRGRVLLADDMGLGKSSTALWAAQELQAEHILVLCPASVKFNWRNEIKETLGLPAFVIDGTPKRRADIFADLLHASLVTSTKPLCAIINYDLLITLSDAHVRQLASFTHNQVLICDESHYLKSRQAARTKFVMEHLAPAKNGARIRLLLTGTPVRNMVDDLWSQIQIVRPGTWTSYWDFAKRHLEMRSVDFGGRGRPVEKVVGTKDVNGLNAVVNTLQIRRIKEDVLDLPPKMHTYPELELVGEHKRIYKAMKNLAVLALSELSDDDTIFAPQARSGILAALRCEQIAQGFCGGVPEPLVEELGKVLGKKAEPIPGRPKEIIFPDSPKIVWILENLDTLFKTGKRPVVFSRFNAPLFWLRKHITEKMARHVKMLHGGATSKDKAEIIESFQNGEYNCLLIQVKMAEGFNLHISQDCIFLGRDWSPAVNHQAEGRLHRIGQKGTVNIQIPIVRGTIETMIHRRLMAKDADAAQALKTVTIKELREAL